MPTLDLATLLVKLRADIGSYKSDMGSARQSTEQLSSGVGSLDGKMSGMGREMDQAAVKAAAYAAKARELDRTLASLGQEIASGNMSVERAGEAYQKARIELDKYGDELGMVNDGSVSAGNSTGQLSTRWTELASKISLAQQAYGAIKQTAAAVYAQISEGAALQLAEQQFDNLASSIGEVSNVLLGDLREATSGMVSDAELVASASSIISLGLADTGEGVVDLSALISNLGWDMNQVILTFANDSKMRLDALGLSVQRVEEIMAELEAQGIETGKAFDLAVIQAGQEKYELLGSTAETTAGSLMRLEAQWANLVARGQAWLLNVADPTIRAFNILLEIANRDGGGLEENARSARNAAEGRGELLEVLKANASAYDESRGVLAKFLGTEGAAARSTADTLVAFARSTGSIEEFRAGLAYAGLSLGDFFRIVEDGGYEMSNSVDEFYEYAKVSATLSTAVDEVAQAEIAQVVSAQDARMANAALTDAYFAQQKAAVMAANASSELDDKVTAVGNQLSEEETRVLKYEQRMRAMEEAQRAAAEAAEALAAATQHQVSLFRDGAKFTDPILEAQQALAEARGEWVTVTRNTSGEIASINADLAADLSSEQQKAYKDILKTAEEGGAEWMSAYRALQGDLTDAQRQALVVRLADLQAAQGETSRAYTGDAKAAEEARDRIIEAQQALQEEYRSSAFEALLASAETTEAFDQAVAAGMAIGAISGPQAEAQLEFMRTKLAVEQLNESFTAGGLTAQEYGSAFNLLMSGMAGSADEAIQRIQNLKTEAAGLTDTLVNEGAAGLGAFYQSLGADSGTDGAVTITPVVDTSEAEVGISEVEVLLTDVTSAEWIASLEADTDTALADVGLLRTDVETTVAPTYTVLTAADVANASADLRGLQDIITQVEGEYGIHFTVTTSGSIPNPAGAAGGSVPGYASGGYTGEYGGIVHPREFVFNETAVANIGVDGMEALHAAAQAGDFSSIMNGGDLNMPVQIISDRGNPMDTVNALNVKMGRAVRLRRAAGMGVMGT